MRSRGGSSTSTSPITRPRRCPGSLPSSRCYTTDHGRSRASVAVDHLADPAPRRQRRAAHDRQLRPGPDAGRRVLPARLAAAARSRGVSVGICGTLHSFPPPADISSYSFYLPDTFAATDRVPGRLEAFQEFNLTMVAASSRNVDTAIPRAAALKFLRHTPKIGIRPRTFAALARQLLAERRRPWLSTRRRRCSRSLAFDLYGKAAGDYRPAFSSFFTNHVASAMHRYWAAGHPADYDEIGARTDDWMDKYRRRGALGDGPARTDDRPAGRVCRRESRLRAVDRLQHGSGSDLRAAAGDPALPGGSADRFLAEPSAVCPRTGGVGGRPCCRSGTPRRRRLRRPPSRRAAVQSPSLGAAACGSAGADDGFFSMEWGQPNLHDQPDAVRWPGGPRACRLGLRSVEIEERSDTTAYHVPEACLAIYDPRMVALKPGVAADVSVLEVAPAILPAFGVPRPTTCRNRRARAGTGPALGRNVLHPSRLAAKRGGRPADHCCHQPDGRRRRVMLSLRMCQNREKNSAAHEGPDVPRLRMIGSSHAT